MKCPYCGQPADYLKGGGAYNPGKGKEHLRYDFSNEPSACRQCWPKVFGSRIPQGAVTSLRQLEEERRKQNRERS